MSLFDTLFEEKGEARQIAEFLPEKVVEISARTVTPLLQIGESGGQRKRFVYENGRTGAVPFFSANGMRGALRRIAFRQQVETLRRKRPDAKIDPSLFYLYTSGGALDKASRTVVEEGSAYDRIEAFRKKAPILSLFGAGLSQVEGWIAVTDLSPAASVQRWRVVEEGGGERLVSQLVGSDTYYRVDSLKEAGLFRNVVDLEAIEKWREEYFALVAKAKKDKKSAKEEGKEAKEEHSNIQQPISLDFIIPGVGLSGSISPKYGYELADYEKGLIVSALAELSMMQIGSAKRIGFGVLEWRVRLGGETMFETRCDPDFVLEREIELTDEGAEAIDTWRTWLDENAENLLEEGR